MRRERSGRILVWMRRAFRLDDHTPLLRALHDADEVIPFIVLREGIAGADATPRRAFIRSVLTDCDDQLTRRGSRLAVRVGDPLREIPAALREWNARAVYAADNIDPESRRRDAAIARLVRREGGEFLALPDRVMQREGTLLTAAGTPYRLFTPFRNAWLARRDEVPPPLRAPRTIPTPHHLAGSIRLNRIPGFEAARPGGGERAGSMRLRRFLQGPVAAYDRIRDLPGEEGTSRLSPFLAHGAISPRRVYAALRTAGRTLPPGARGGITSFLNELIWREFYYHLLHHFPFVVNEEFREEFRGLRWKRDQRSFDAWREGRTGYPIVDAAMRQLASTGWMHNRARMITASFLVKDLQVDWRRGEQHFFEHLIDGDIASNNGGWQWVAGTGTDASPWFRIFNPTVQGKKFDPRGEYVRKFLPALKDLPPRMIHTPWAMGGVGGYPSPLVSHEEARELAVALYKGLRR